MPSISPIVSATIQAILFSATSNILAQALAAYQGNKPFTIDTTALTQFVLFAVLSTPPNFLWQEWLEHKFPSHTPTASKSQKESKESPRPRSRTFTTPSGEVFEKPVAPPSPTKLNARNTACKFALDQTVGGTLNTISFIAGLGALQGWSGERIAEAVKHDTWPMMLAGYRFWPLVSIINYTLVPFQWRLAFQSLASVGWGIFLCLAAGGR